MIFTILFLSLQFLNNSSMECPSLTSTPMKTGGVAGSFKTFHAQPQMAFNKENYSD